MKWQVGWLVAWMMCLVACGGADGHDPQRMAMRMHAAVVALASDGSTSVETGTIDAKALFDWAERTYPAWFPAGPANQTVVFQGVAYTVRAYANGNYLGLTAAGGVYGLGPLTNHVLLDLGHISDYAAVVRVDACRAAGLECVAPSFARLPRNVSALAGQVVTFSVAVVGQPTPGVRWQLSGDGGVTFVDIEGATSADFTTPPLQLKYSGLLLRVRLDSLAGTAFSAPVVVTVSRAGDSSYFPVDPGSQWVYAVAGAARPEVVRVVGTQVVEGRIGSVFETTRATDGSLVRDIYVVSSEGVKDHAEPGADPVLRALSGVQLLRFPVQVGTSFQQLDVAVDTRIDADGDGRNDAVRVQSTATVVGIESVWTDVEDFHAAMHQRQDVVLSFMLTSGRQVPDGRGTIDTWYADGVGVVRQEIRLSSLGASSFESRILSAYRVGGRRGDVTGPVLESLLPAADGVGGATTTVSATFSEPVDPASIKPETFTVFDSAGAGVPGTIRVDGRRLEFTPDRAWAGSGYTARIANDVQDWSGNALALGKTWSFSVDLTGPSVVSVTPVMDSTGVAREGPLAIQFSEAVDAASVNPRSVHLQNSDLVYGPDLGYKLTVNGSRVTLTPTVLLDRGQLYTLRVSGIRDLLGNGMPEDYRLDFRVGLGRFASPVPIAYPRPWGMTVAIGDVNGDGLDDLVVNNFGAATEAERGVYALTGRPDGTLGAAERVDLGDRFPCLSSMEGTVSIGDLNSDGRADLVVGSRTCGALVLYQGDGGRLVPAEVLPPGSTAILKIVDLQGAGRHALIGIEGVGTQVKIWSRGPAGVLEVSQVLSVGAGHVRDVAVGDINGDGHPDLVFAVFAEAGSDVAVQLGLPDGGFAPPRYLNSPSLSSGDTVAVGDVNGDGRTDIVVGGPEGVVVFHQGAGGAVGPAEPVSAFPQVRAVAVADIDGDGLLDVVVLDPDGVSIHVQQASGVLGQGDRYSTARTHFHPQQMAIGDLNGDGRLDVVINGYLQAQLPPATPVRAAIAADGTHGAAATPLSTMVRTLLATTHRRPAEPNRGHARAP